jgi:serine/threonine-protein kinase
MRCLLRGGLDDAADKPMSSEADEAGEFGEYRIAREEDGSLWELGRGAMGVTYRGYDTVLHHSVALKVIDADLAAHPRAQARFLREARAAAGLRHPNIAGVYRFGVCPDGRCYYAMELVEGETLEERVRRDGPLPVECALDVAEQVTSALLAAEKAGVVHRDLKPANIMLVHQESDRAKPVVKVIDFGLAKAAAGTVAGQAAELTMGGFIGTPGFASPEQFDPTAPLDTRSDIFSLGVTLWYLLTANVPFLGRSLRDIHEQQIAAQLPVAQLASAAVPVPVRDLLRELLAPDLQLRPQSARALAERLQQCREALRRQASTKMRRRRSIATTVTVAALLLLAAAAGWYLKDRRSVAVTTAGGVNDVEKSIAVLPFNNLGDNEDDAYFAEGMQNDIIAALGRISGLRVISRTSVTSYRAATGGRSDLRATAEALRVGYVLEGSVRRADGRVRIDAQLIDARNDTHIWSRTYEREVAQIFTVQDELADQIASDLRIRLSPEERKALHSAPRVDAEAYDLLLRARQLLDAFADTFEGGNMLPEAIRLLEKAVARDPAFLSAWCQLSQAHLNLYWYGFDRTPERLASARQAVDSAVRLDANAGETHLALALYHYHGFRDYERARTELTLARRTLPNSAEIPFLAGMIARRQGLWDESERNLRRALELDPRNTRVHEQLAINLRVQRRYGEMATLLDEALRVAPGSTSLRQARARTDLDRRADPAELRNALETIVREEPAAAAEAAEALLEATLCARDASAAERALAVLPAAGVPVHGAAVPRSFFEGLVARTFGDEPRAVRAFETARVEAARGVARQPDFAFAHSVLGQVDAALGRREEAIAAGLRAIELLPVGRDAIGGPELLINLASIYAWSGEPELAIDRLEEAGNVPSRVSFGLLKLHPRWDALRGNPRFEALVERLGAAAQ